MRINVLTLLVIIFLLNGCGSLMISPQNCKTQNGVWNNSKIELKSTSEKSLTQSYDVYFNDKTIKLRDFFKDHGLDCGQIKKLRLDLASTFLWRRDLTVYYEQ